MKPLMAYWQVAILAFCRCHLWSWRTYRTVTFKLDQNARVYAFDKDPQALEVAAQLEQEDSVV